MPQASFRRAVRAASRSAAPVLAGLTALLAVAGCGSSSEGDGSSGGSTCEGGLRQGSALTPAGNSEFCAGQSASLPDEVSCSYSLQACNVPTPKPDDELTRSANVREYAGTGAPNVACFAPDNYAPDSGEPGTATVEGVVKIFSHGCESNGVVITMHPVNADGSPGAAIGAAVTTPEDCEADGVESDKDYSCATGSGKPWHCRYSYPGVPTGKELIIKTTGVGWKDVYEYNVYVPNSEAGGTFTKDVRALFADDYQLIAQTALGGPIAPGRGAIAGEVHDCDDVRLVDAVVGIDQNAKILTYFGADEDHPLPDTGSQATSVLGLYAAIDVAPGPVTISAVGMVGGEPVVVGFHKAQVFANSVTSVTFRGLRPFQLPKE